MFRLPRLQIERASRAQDHIPFHFPSTIAQRELASAPPPLTRFRTSRQTGSRRRIMSEAD
jgi:hypothetical protein